jgi:glutamyl-tRNA synthetase
MTVVTRFAPSPTGFLHIGGARTALFNWLYARHHGGKYLLRIEDTDRKRSTQEAIDAILEGLDWLGLSADEPPVFQSARQQRHSQVALELLESGNAYHCYCSPEELAEMRETARAEGRTVLYDGRWRDRDPSEAPAGVPPVVRLKAPRDGETVIEDSIQGDVRVANSQLDDIILLRADGTPTYMLSVVVDDHDMGITHVIRGDDHLTNAFRQINIYRAIGWDNPVFAHMPLTHGADGAKLSKRHGALGIDAYRDMGYLPEALLNYLMRLGWSHGDDEIFPIEKAIEWFDLPDVNKGAARLDFDKLAAVNSHYIRESDNQRLLELALPGLEEKLGKPVNDDEKKRLIIGLDGLKPRAKTINELVDNALFYVFPRPLNLDQKADKILTDEARTLLAALQVNLHNIGDWNAQSVEDSVRALADARELKLGQIAQPLRAALCGSTVSPGIFEVAAALGRDETLGRLEDIVGGPS